MIKSLRTAASISSSEAKVAAAVAEAENDVVVETANGVVETVHKLKVSIVVGVATKEALAKIKMVS